MSGQQHDVYQKVGRGGAGNFYASTQANEAARDLEAQELNNTDVVPPPHQSTSHVPSRAGRGGAGNYVEAAKLPSAREQQELAEKTAAAMSASLKLRSRGITGRGGAGNFSWEAEEAKKAEEREKKTKGEEIEQQAKDAVDQGLKQPDRVHHHQHHKDKHDGA